MTTYRWKLRAPYFKGAGCYPLAFGNTTITINVDKDGFFETCEASGVPLPIVAQPIVSAELQRVINANRFS